MEELKTYEINEDKSKAAAELEDVIDKLMGEKKTRKMTIRRRLKKLQKTRIKQFGLEILQQKI